MKKRVVVTGIGAVSPLGNDAATTWENVLAGKSGVGPLTRLDPDQYSAKVAAEVKDFDIEKYVERKEARKMDRFTHYAVAAAMMAVKDADLEINETNANNIGVWIGSGIGGLETFENQFEVFQKKRLSPSKSVFCPNDDSRYGNWSSFYLFRCKRG